MASYRVVTYAERPDLLPEINLVQHASWPELMLHDPVANQFWPRLFSTFSAYQFMLLDVESELIAVANTVPLRWDGTVAGLPEGLDAALERSFAGADAGTEPDTLCALAAIVALPHRRRGLSVDILRNMRRLAASHGLAHLIAPVRPTMKARYPLTPMERYIAWTQPDGLPFDPWMRVHHRLGGRILVPAPRSMVILGSVSEWESWTGMAFPESGRYVVPDALSPIEIDREQDRGVYVEPNVWMVHSAIPEAR